MEKARRNRIKPGSLARGVTALDMVFIPVISTANPTMMVPISFWRFFLPVLMRITPTMARIGEKEVGFKNRSKKLVPSTSVRLRIHAVTVVPTFAPRITPVAWASFIIPELTKPTTITVVAEDDCITAVTPAPSKTAISLLLVSFSRICSIFPPDAFLSPSPSTLIPYRKRARPPTIVRKSNMSISSLRIPM